jgi:hypothetical protein
MLSFMVSLHAATRCDNPFFTRVAAGGGGILAGIWGIAPEIGTCRWKKLLLQGKGTSSNLQLLSLKTNMPNLKFSYNLCKAEE